LKEEKLTYQSVKPKIKDSFAIVFENDDLTKKSLEALQLRYKGNSHVEITYE